MNKAGLNAGKFFLYLLGKVAAVALAGILIYIAFFTALNSANVFIVTKDAFAKRTSVILRPEENGDIGLLDKIFTTSYLRESKLATQRTNADYVINNYSERTDVNVALVFPWTKTITVRAKNVVDNISAVLKNENSTEYHAVQSFIESGEYDVTLMKKGNGWIVSDIELIETVEPKDVKPIPTPRPLVESAAPEEETGEEETEEESESPEAE